MFKVKIQDCMIFFDSMFCLYEMQLIVFFFQMNVSIRYFEGVIHPHSICDVMKEYRVDHICVERMK